MSFTGKATYSAGSTLPELAEDVADLVAIASPLETPLLEALGDPGREALSTRHEWMEDELLPNEDAIDDATWVDPDVDMTFNVDHGSRFRVGDQIQVEGSAELMLVTAVGGNLLTVERGYGGTTPENLANNLVLHILGNASLEAAEAPTARFVNRARMTNYTQIFSKTIQVSGSHRAALSLAGVDEIQWQRYCRLVELLRDLESSVINGAMATTDPQGGDTVRRTMQGIIPALTTNRFTTEDSGFPAGTTLTEAMLNYALRKIWERASSHVDLIVCNGFQKRKINAFVSSSRHFSAGDATFRDNIGIYESDFGVCQCVLTRWVPPDTILLLDRSRLAVLPLAGRSFHYEPLAQTGDYEQGILLGEYTLELRNEAAHGLIRGLDTAEAQT